MLGVRHVRLRSPRPRTFSSVLSPRKVSFGAEVNTTVLAVPSYSFAVPPDKPMHPFYLREKLRGRGQPCSAIVGRSILYFAHPRYHYEDL